MEIAKEMFRQMVIEKYLDRKGMKDISFLLRITKDDLNTEADNDFEKLLSDKEKMLLDGEDNKVKVEVELRKLLDKTSFNMNCDIRS